MLTLLKCSPPYRPYPFRHLNYTIKGCWATLQFIIALVIQNTKFGAIYWIVFLYIDNRAAKGSTTNIRHRRRNRHLFNFTLIKCTIFN